MQLILIMFAKKFNKISILFMTLSIIFIYFIAYYNACLNEKYYVVLLDFNTYVNNYILETEEVISFTGLFFILLLSELELLGNSESFDSYFIVSKGRLKTIIAKIISYLIIIVLFTLFIYLGITIIYLIRFQNMYYLMYVFKLFGYRIIYFIFIFLLSFLIIQIFKNYFAVLIPLGLYWVTRMDFNKNINKIMKYLYLNIEYDVINKKIDFGIYHLEYLYLSVLLILIVAVYHFKNIKC